MKYKTPAEKHTFARRLTSLMDEQRISKSDLARRMWGNRPDGSAQNRDLITAWTTARTFPSEGNLGQLAQALHVPVVELALPLGHAAGTVKAVPGAPDRVVLKIEQDMPLWLASEILRLINKSITTFD